MSDNVADLDRYFRAAETGDVEIVRECLEKWNIHVNASDEEFCLMWTALHRASHYGHRDVVDLLLRQPEIDINQRSRTGYTALMIAVYYGHLEVVLQLANREEVDLAVVNNDGHCVLHECMFPTDGHKIAQVLLSRGRDVIHVNQRNNYGATPFYFALTSDKRDVARVLMRVRRVMADEGVVLFSTHNNMAVEQTALILRNDRQLWSGDVEYDEDDDDDEEGTPTGEDHEARENGGRSARGPGGRRGGYRGRRGVWVRRHRRGWRLP